MRAVNLIDVTDRRGGGGGAAGRSGGAAYLLLGLLAVLVALAGAYALADRSVSTKTDQLAVVQRDAARAETRVAELQAFTRFADLKARRVQTVQSIAATRYDWAHTMHELARVIPDKVALTALNATVTPGAGTGGGSGASNSLRGALSVPALEMQGCAVGYPRLSQLMTRLRLMDGVTRVSLQSSQSGDKAASASPGSATGACSGAKDTAFNVVAFLDPVTTRTDPTVTAPAAASGPQPVIATTTGAAK